MGAPVSAQTFSRWVVSTIKLAYEIAHKPLPATVRAHSTRAMASSMAFLRGVNLADVCKAATWSTPFTFAAYYRLDVRAKAEAAVSRAVLASVLS